MLILDQLPTEAVNDWCEPEHFPTLMDAIQRTLAASPNTIERSKK